MRTLLRWTMALAPVLLAACEVADGGLVGPGGSEAAVHGRVERETETFTGASSAAPDSADGSGGKSVEVARIEGDGRLRVLARGSVGADGSYRIEGVPTGRSDLVVVARSSAGVELGRVLLAGETQAGGELIAAPMTAETTMQGLVYAELRAAGAAAAGVSSAELELLLPAGESQAAIVARSEAEVRALAKASAEAVETMTRTYSRLGHAVSVQARQRLLLSAQAAHHARKHHSESVEASYGAFLDAAVDALVEGGAAADAVVLATAAGRVAAHDVLAGLEATGSTRLALARGAARLNLAARARLLARLPGSADGKRRATADALARAIVQVRMAVSAAQVEQVMKQAEVEARQGLLFEVAASLIGSVGEVRATVEAAFAAAFEAADFAAAMEGEASAQARAEAAAGYRQRVRAAAEAYADSTPDGTGVEASAAADLLVAARAG